MVKKTLKTQAVLKKPKKTVKRRKKTKKPTAKDLKHITPMLRPLAMHINEIGEDPANARAHPQRNLDATSASLRRYGQRKPVVVNRRDMTIEAGNGSYQCAKQLGWEYLAVVLVDDDPTTATGYAIADNRTGELAEWDLEILSGLLKSLDEQVDKDDLIDMTGFDDFELEPLLASSFDGISDPGWNDEDESSPPQGDDSVSVVFSKDQWADIQDELIKIKESEECDDAQAIVLLIRGE